MKIPLIAGMTDDKFIPVKEALLLYAFHIIAGCGIHFYFIA